LKPDRPKKPPFLARYPGPLFEREMRVLGKRWSVSLIRGLYALGLLLLIAIIVANRVGGGSRIMRGDRGAAALSKIESYQEIAPGILIAVLWFQMIVLSLAAAALCGPAIVEDRKAGTLATLLTTPLSVRQIVIGKLAGRASELLLLLLLALPVVLCLRVLGGVDLPTLLVGFGLTLACALTTACVSLFASARARNAPMGILGGVLTTALLFAGPITVMALITVSRRSSRGSATSTRRTRPARPSSWG
jgi:ABC-type transport system involved in multi-copper enzyme maturation permease subunit